MAYPRRAILHSGNANITYKSIANEEFVYRMTGPVVLQVLGKLALHRQKGRSSQPLTLFKVACSEDVGRGLSGPTSRSSV